MVTKSIRISMKVKKILDSMKKHKRETRETYDDILTKLLKIQVKGDIKKNGRNQTKKSEKIWLVISGIFLIMVLVGTYLVIAAQLATQGESVTLSDDFNCYFFSSKRIDMDGSDGLVTYIYGAWALEAPSGVIQQGGADMINDTNVNHGWGKTITFTASEIGTYRLITTGLYVEQKYDSTTMSWQTTGSGTCGDTAGDIVTLHRM